MYLATLPSSFGIDPWATESAQMLPLGAIGYDFFGNQYRYGQQNATTDSVAGDLYQSLPIDTAFVDMAVPTAVAIGAKAIGVTLGGSATTASQFANGSLTISVAPGIGQRFTINTHEVKAGAATAIFNVLEAVTVALSTASKVTVIPNPYGPGIVINPTAKTGQIVGVSVSVITKAQFGWYQTHGNGSALCDATVGVLGDGISPSVTTAGAVTKAITLKDRIGTFYVAPVSAKVEPVFLNIN